MKIKLLATLVFLSFYFHINAQNSAVTVYDLKSEYLTNPIGLDTKKPRFTWKIKDQRRGAVQNAYQITVGKDSAKVASGQGSLWKTQKIKSDHQRVVYDGKKLQAFKNIIGR
jgi:alpha-L-rhamnosidase